MKKRSTTKKRSTPDRDSTPPLPKRTPGWVKVVLIIGGVLVALRLFSWLAISGTSGYLNDAKMSEGKSTVGAIARGMVACMEGGGVSPLLRDPGSTSELPPSEPPVPASVPKGTKFMSRDSDWASPAFQCAKFTLNGPVYFQYQWERVSPLVGVVHARGDLDGDGRVDADLSEEIRCTTAGVCTLGVLTVK